MACIHICGVIAALEALYVTRSSQGAIAWGLSLITLPYLTLPFYLVFGRRYFRGYSELQKEFRAAHRAEVEMLEKHLQKHNAPAPPLEQEVERVVEEVAQLQFTDRNAVRLLIDGEATFSALFESIDSAREVVLLQFYIVRADEIGSALKQRLLDACRRGVRVYFLFDEVGSQWLSSAYLDQLRRGGVRIEPFATRQGVTNFFQLNFRNHRKVVVVDGRTAFVGGHNVGDEYLGKTKRYGPWRDTHIRVEGPSVLQIQAAFFADWLWATKEALALNWNNLALGGNQHVLALASGPVDERDRCLLFFLEAIRVARRRLWIASPYFVPDDSIIKALQLAALRGVDVRIMLPANPDQYLVWLASFSYVPEICSYGVKCYRYKSGFLHQKVMLLDDSLAAVGTANLDNRSFNLNFEITMIVADETFAAQVADMFERDFGACVEERLSDFWQLPIHYRVGAKIARLFGPVL